jgi:hypothetical protein
MLSGMNAALRGDPKRKGTAEMETVEKTSASPAVAAGLSMLMEGVGQAYNRQPVKAAAFLATGVTLSSVSGLNTWIARNVLGLKGTRLGPDKVQPGLVLLWAGTFALNVADAWRTARRIQ